MSFHEFKSRLTPCIPVGMLCVLTVWPLLVSGPPTGADGPNHFYRFVELEWHVRHGVLYPRWFSNLHFGYGAPVLSYYVPLSSYLLLFIRLFGFSQPTAFLLGHVLAVVVAVTGMYHWSREQFGTIASALVAAAAYGLSPYLYFTLISRTSYPEIWALAIAPWLFWLTLRNLGQSTNLLTLSS